MRLKVGRVPTEKNFTESYIAFTGVSEGSQATAKSVDELFAGEIAAQRTILADRRKVVEAEKWKRLREQRAKTQKPPMQCHVKRRQSPAKQESESTTNTAQLEAERTKSVAERETDLEVQRLAKRRAEIEVQRLAEERAKIERQILVERRTYTQNLAEQRAKMERQRQTERQHNMRQQEKLLEQIYAGHNIDVVKVETPSGGSMYAPWDSSMGDILAEQKVEELAQEGIHFWLEAGTRVSVAEHHESLKIPEEATMSG
ncbi:hypothetical protein MMC11_006517 [Xylographa trunciseda]|nr:hypothetical protein [Xylographa trunciseda]